MRSPDQEDSLLNQLMNRRRFLWTTGGFGLAAIDAACTGQKRRSSAPTTASPESPAPYETLPSAYPYDIIFVHGYTATPQSDWYPEMAQDLTAAYVQYEILPLTSDLTPDPTIWVGQIHQYVEQGQQSQREIVLVGHSLGTRAVLLYLDQFPPPKPFKEVFLIAAFANDTAQQIRSRYGNTFDEHYASFFTHKLDTDKIRQEADKFVIMHSRDDPTIPFAEGEALAQELSAQLMPFEGQRHMNSPQEAPAITGVLEYELGIKP